MARFQGLRRFFRLDRTADVDRAVNDELDFHFENKVRELMDRGMPAAEARAEAERKFGDVERTRARLAAIDRERVGGERRAEWWSGFAQDLRYALRGLRLKPGFALGVVITLGLGIGANATMFGIVDRLLLRGPAYLPDAGSVNRFYFRRTFDGVEAGSGNTSYRRFLDLKQGLTTYDQLTAFFTTRLAIGTGEDAREMDVMLASASIWPLFGDAKPVIGRFYAPDEDAVPAGTTVAVLSYRYWQTRYGRRTDVLGQRMRIGTHDYTIIGVAPRGFVGPSLNMPIAFIPIMAGAIEMDGMPAAEVPTTYSWSWAEVMGRRKPGVSLATATADLTRGYLLSYESQHQVHPGLTPASITRPHVIAGPILLDRGPNQGPDSKVATWLIGVAAIVLIIACANVGNLLLARAFARRREIAVRLALGISRSRLLTQLLTESLLLAAIGGALGLFVAQWAGGMLRSMMLPNVPWTGALADSRVLAFAAVATLVAGLLTGLAPAWHAGRADVAADLKAGVREGTYHRSVARTLLLVVQGALSVLLLVGAGLFVRSLHNVKNMRLGYEPARVVYVGLDMRGESLGTAGERLLRERLLERASALPVVEHASRNMTVPLWMTMSQTLYVAGIDSTDRLGSFELQAITPGYFATMGTRVVRGRPIAATDVEGAEPVIVVSESMAKILWPGKEALGQCVRIRSQADPCRTVVGIAENIYTGDIREAPALNYYLPIAQWRPERGGLFVRARGDGIGIVETVRSQLQGLMPGASYVTVTPLAEILYPQMRSFELGATMFTIFGVLALVVAAVGLYSVIAYGVAQRTHELGVRVALGAQARDVVRLVLVEALRVAALAAAIGTLAALVAGKWIKPLLFETSPRDPWILGAVAMAMLVIATIASLSPALRAARVDPNIALRAD